MPGRTGKRSKAPSVCAECKQKITGAFMRTRDGDFHEGCWWKRYHPNSVHAK